MPDTVNISVGDTVRWTWESEFHSVTSGTSCTEDGQFCSPDNMHCEAGILNDTGFVYEFTFTQPGMYQYFCALHCFAGMTGVVNVLPAVRPLPKPRPRPTPVAAAIGIPCTNAMCALVTHYVLPKVDRLLPGAVASAKAAEDDGK